MTDWRDEPITRKQITMLKSVDDYFTFDRLEGMTKGQASDYIEEYYKDGKLVEGNVNMRYREECKMVGKDKRDGVNDIVRDIVNEAAKIVMKRYGIWEGVEAPFLG